MKHRLLALCCATLAASLSGCDNTPPAQPAAAPAADSTPLQGTGATLEASPNPVVGGSGPGKATITWNAGPHPEAAVFVVSDDAPENLFATGSEGSSEAPWIQPGKRYEFRLYSNKDKATLLQRVTVSGSKP